MKKILFVLLLVYSTFSFAQGGPKVDVIKFRGEIDTSTRDALTVPVGETWMVFNTTTGNIEFAASDNIWHDITQLPLIDDDTFASASASNVASAESIAAYIANYAVKLTGITSENRSSDFIISDTGTGVAGFQITGVSDASQMNGGVVGNQHSLVINGNGIYSASQTNSVIDALGADAITTKDYTDTNYINQSNLLDDDTFAAASATTVPSSESVKAYVDANVGGGASLPVDDTTSLVQDPVDGTKEMRIDVGAVSTATSRTLTMPDADVDLGNLGAANLDLAANFTWAGSHVFPSLTRVASILNLSDAAGGDIISYAAFTESDGTTTKGYVGYNSTLGVVLNNNTTSERLRLLDAGGGLLNADLTADSFIKSGATSDDVLLGDGTTGSFATKINTTISGRTGTAINSAQLETAAQIASNPAIGTNELVICSNCSPAEVVATATIAMDGWKMYDDQTADAATITLSDCDPGETLTVYINRASAPTLAGTGLTFNQLPNTTAFAAATTMMIIFEVAYDGTTIDYYYVER